MTLFIFLEFIWGVLMHIEFIKYTKKSVFLGVKFISSDGREMAIQIITPGDVK